MMDPTGNKSRKLTMIAMIYKMKIETMTRVKSKTIMKIMQMQMYHPKLTQHLKTVISTIKQIMMMKTRKVQNKMIINTN